MAWEQMGNAIGNWPGQQQQSFTRPAQLGAMAAGFQPPNMGNFQPQFPQQQQPSGPQQWQPMPGQQPAQNVQPQEQQQWEAPQPPQPQQWGASPAQNPDMTRYRNLNSQQQARVNQLMQDPSQMGSRMGKVAQIAQAGLDRRTARGVAPEQMGRPMQRTASSVGGYNAAGASGGEFKRLGGSKGTSMAAAGPDPIYQRQNARRMR